jgi:hypothetical protein
VPTPSRWYPSPTAADADNGGEDWEVAPEVMKVSEVTKVMEVLEVMSWRAKGDVLHSPADFRE